MSIFRNSSGAVRGRFTRAALVGASVCFVSAGVAFASSQVVTGNSGSPRTEAAPASGTKQLIDSSTLLTPTNPAEMRDYLKLEQFEALASTAASAKCLEAAGYAAPTAAAPSLLLHVHHFEDPDVLRTLGFEVFTGARPAASIDAPSNNAPSDVEATCAKDGVDAVDPIEAAERPLWGAWMQEIDRVEKSDALAPAWAQWSSCMKDAGYNFDHDDDVFQYVDSGVLRGSINQDGELAVASAYASCIEGQLSAARASARASARVDFQRTNAERLSSSTSVLNQQIELLSREYGVEYPN